MEPGLIIIVGIALLLGGYLIFKPRSYGEEMAGLGHMFGTFPAWAIRVLGAVLISIAIGLSYLYVTGGK